MHMAAGNLKQSAGFISDCALRLPESFDGEAVNIAITRALIHSDVQRLANEACELAMRMIRFEEYLAKAVAP